MKTHKSATKCDSCGETRSLTREHRIPRWLITRASLLGIKVKTSTLQENIKILCANCNMDKGGSIDYTDPFVRSFMREIAVKIVEELKKPVTKI